MDFERIKKVVETSNTSDVNIYLDTKRWVVMTAAPGQREDGSAYCLLVLGWYGPLDAEYPKNDTSEYPAGISSWAD